MQWNADLYNSKHAFVFEFGSSLVDLLSPQEHERILDLGSGTGKLTKEISLKANEVIGLEKSPGMLERSRADFPNIRFIEGNAKQFHFDKPFDAIFSNATLHWITDFEKPIASMYNNLKKGGRLVLEFGGKGNVQSIILCLKKSLTKRSYFEQAQIERWYFPSISEYSSALEKQGFEVVFAQLYNRPTILEDEKSGIIDWLKMFASAYFSGIPDSIQLEIMHETQDDLRPILFKDGQWIADYRRIQIVAYKP